MHELQIAQNIIDIVEKAAKDNNAKIVKTVAIKVGDFTCISKDALLFCLDINKENTALVNAKVEITTVPLIVRCPSCLKEYGVKEADFLCKICGKPTEIISGREFYVDYIDVE